MACKNTPYNYNYTGKLDGFFNLPICQNKVFWWTQRHCCRDIINKKTAKYGSFAKFCCTSTLLIFRLTEVIAMVAQLYTCCLLHFGKMIWASIGPVFTIHAFYRGLTMPLHMQNPAACWPQGVGGVINAVQVESSPLSWVKVCSIPDIIIIVCKMHQYFTLLWFVMCAWMVWVDWNNTDRYLLHCGCSAFGV